MLRSRYTERSIAVNEQFQSQQRQHHQQHVKQQQETNQPRSNQTTLGSIKVYAPEVLRSLGPSCPASQPDEKQIVANVAPASSLKSPHRSTKKAGHGRTASMIDLLWQEMQQVNAANNRSVREAVDRNQRVNQARIDRDYAEYQRGNSSFVHESRSYLALDDQQQAERRAAVYEHWSKHVFTPIQQQVNAHVDAQHAQVHRFRRALFEHYLNERGSSVAFIAPNLSVSDPPAAPASFAYSTADIDSNDPTFATLRLQQSHPSHSLPVNDHASRSTFSANMWSKLDATPYGRYSGEAAPLSPSQLEQIERGVRVRMAEMGFDHYEDPPEPAAETKGKRIVQLKASAYNIINNLE